MTWDAQSLTDLIFRAVLHGEGWLQRKKAVLSFSLKSHETLAGLISSLALWDKEGVGRLAAQLRPPAFAFARSLCHVAGG